MILSVHQPQYLPWLGFFDKVARSDAFLFLDRVQYKPREFQNRNRIRTKDGPLWLSVPVVTKERRFQSIADVKIDDGFPWRRQHLKSIQVWYATAPHLKEHLPFFEDVFARKWGGLTELNVHVIRHLLGVFGITTPLSFESEIGTTEESTGRIIELCRKLKADTYLSGAGGKQYLDEAAFGAAGIKLLYQEYAHPRYRQQFMKDAQDFIPCMSAVDLLFNEGPAARGILSVNGGKQ